MAVSIDVGTNIIHILTGQAKSGYVTVDDFRLIKIPEENLSESPAFQQRKALALVKPALEAMKVKRTDCHFTLSDDRVLIRELTLPKAPEKDLRGMAKQEMISLYNASSDDIVEIGNIAQQPDDKVSLRAAALSKELVEGYVKFASDFSLTPKSLSVHSNNIGKLVGYKPRINDILIDGRTVLLADFGMFSCIVHVITDGKSIFSRYLPVGFADFNKIFTASNNQIEPDASRGRVIATFDTNSRDYKAYPSYIPEQVEAFFNRLSDEVNKLLRFLFSSKITNNVDSLFLFGGNAKIQGLERRLEESVDVRTEAVRSVSTIKISSRDADELPFLLNCAGSLV